MGHLKQFYKKEKLFYANSMSISRISIKFSTLKAPNSANILICVLNAIIVSPEIFCLSEPCGGRCHEDDNIFRHHTASLQLWRIQI
jgi:hypothetical protein